MASTLISASDCAGWRAALMLIGEIDCTYLPEYHLAYRLRIEGSIPLMWRYSCGGEHFLYPFLLTPVMDTGGFDISSVYGYTGPIATTTSPEFLSAAWQAFDDYAAGQKIIAEFVRFSPFNENQRFAHPKTMVEANRNLAVSNLPGEDALPEKIDPKTRNMLRKAERAGLVARELTLPEHLPAFRRLYDDTMSRNQASEFFRYDDAYWHHLLMLGQGLRLFGVFAEDTLVAAAMSVSHGKSGLYHLGASLTEYARQGAGNLSLFAMSRGLLASGVTFINMTGGRTTAADDPLLLFKKSNATGTATFYIGKRIINSAAYEDMKKAWAAREGKAPDAAKIIFWRA